MAKGFVGIEVKGFDKVLSKHKRIPKELVSVVDAELGAGANDMENRAVADAPRDQGALVNLISSKREKAMHWVVVSAAEWSAFIEFGTRSKVQVPSELQAVASQFRGVTTGKGAKEMIYAWCKRKGIEEKLWWPIFISIMTKGINPHPFFYKNFYAIQPQVQKNIEAAFKRVING